MGKGFFFIGHYYDGIRLIVMIRESVCIVLYEIQNNDIRLDELNTTLERECHQCIVFVCYLILSFFL